MADSAFSDDGKYFSTISHDGRLKIWDTESNVLKQEFTPDLHLSSPPSCLQWILTSNTETPRKIGKKRSASFSEQQDHCIALGTSNGRILIYSISQAKVVTVLEDVKNSEIQNAAVTALDWHKSYGLFSSNKEGYVYDWDLSSGSVRYKYNVIFDSKNKKASSVSAIKIIPHSQASPCTYLVTASWQVRLWRLSQGSLEPVRTLGHSAQPRPVLALVTLDGQRSWLIEGSQNERLLSFWDVTIPSVTAQHNGDAAPCIKQARKSSPAEAPSYRLVLEERARSVQARVSRVSRGEGGGVELQAAAVTRSGVLHYYSLVLNGSTVKPIKPSVTLQACTPGAALVPLVCGACHAEAPRLTVGYQPQPGTIAFERLTPDTSSKTQVLIRGEEAKGKPRAEPGSAAPVHYREPTGGVGRKRAEPGAKVEVAMEARLANLALDTNTRSRSAVNQNLTKLLAQGLHSNDKNLIQMVLREEEAGVSLRTLAGLPPRLLPRLLTHLTELASGRTQQCACACRWAAALCGGAAAAVAAAAAAGGDTAERLARLLAILTQRRSQLCQLLNLKGRLDLTIAQRGTKIDLDDTAEAILTYNDTSSDEEEMQVECPSSESGGEEEWGGGGAGEGGGGGGDETGSDSEDEDDD